jgi:hypothetical protein
MTSVYHPLRIKRIGNVMEQRRKSEGVGIIVEIAQLKQAA